MASTRFIVFAFVFAISLLLWLHKIYFLFGRKPSSVADSLEFESEDPEAYFQLTDVEGVTSLIHQCCHGHLLMATSINATLLAECVTENLSIDKSRFDVFGHKTCQRRYLKFADPLWDEPWASLSVGSAGGRGDAEADLRKRYPSCRVYTLKSSIARQDQISKVAPVVPALFEQKENVSATEPTQIGEVLRHYVGTKIIPFLNIHSLTEWLVEAILNSYFRVAVYQQNYSMYDPIICQISLQVSPKDVKILREMLEYSHYTPIFVKSVGTAILLTVADLQSPYCESVFQFKRHIIMKPLTPSIDIEDQVKPKDIKWDPDLFLNGRI